MESPRRQDAKLTVVSDKVDLIAKEIVDSCFKVHQYFGPGMLESIYESALFRELQKRNLNVQHQALVPVFYDGELLEDGFRADLIVEDSILLELKACETLLPVHRAQALSYIRLANKPLGFLINFNVPVIKNGIVRIINDRLAS